MACLACFVISIWALQADEEKKKTKQNEKPVKFRESEEKVKGMVDATSLFPGKGKAAPKNLYGIEPILTGT